jgi:hypothetical protein
MVRKFDPNKQVKTAQDAVLASYKEEDRQKAIVAKRQRLLDEAKAALEATVTGREGAIGYLEHVKADVPARPEPEKTEDDKDDDADVLHTQNGDLNLKDGSLSDPVA